MRAFIIIIIDSKEVNILIRGKKEREKNSDNIELRLKVAPLEQSCKEDNYCFILAIVPDISFQNSERSPFYRANASRCITPSI